MTNNYQKQKKEEMIGQILDTATEVFAEVGFAGARVDEIAKRAGVNKAMIYYRIGDKEALFSMALHNIFEVTVDRISLKTAEEKTPEGKLRVYISNMTCAPDQHPLMPRIMMHELASGGHHLPQTVKDDLTRCIGILAGILEEGEIKGVFIETNPVMIHMMIAGTMAFYLTLAPIREAGRLFPDAFADKEKNYPRSVSEEVERLIINAIKKSE